MNKPTQEIEEMKKKGMGEDKKEFDEMLKDYNEKKSNVLMNKMKKDVLQKIFKEHNEKEVPEDVNKLTEQMTAKQFYNYLKKEYAPNSEVILAPKKIEEEKEVTDLPEEYYSKILQNPDIDDALAGHMDENDPMTQEKVAEILLTLDLDNTRIEKVFNENPEFKTFIEHYVKQMNDSNVHDKPKLIDFLKHRLLDKENKAMGAETTEEEKEDVAKMDKNQFGNHLHRKKIAVVRHKAMDFIQKGGNIFNKMYIEEHLRRGLKGVLKPNYLRDLANQTGVDLKTLNALDKNDGDSNKLFNDQLKDIRDGIKKSQDDENMAKEKEKEKQDKKQKQKEVAQKYLQKKNAQPSDEDEMPELEEDEPLKINRHPTTPDQKGKGKGEPGTGFEALTPMTATQQKVFMEQLQQRVTSSGDKLTDRESTSLELLQKKGDKLTPKEKMKVDFVVQSVSPIKDDLPKYNTRSKDQKTDFKLYESAHNVINNWEKEATNIMQSTFQKKLATKLGKTEEEVKKLNSAFGLYTTYKSRHHEKKKK